MSGLKYIAIEGPIGIGKTSLARKLAESFKAACILESAEENPFIAQFYSDRRRYAFKTQIFFLLARYEQLKGLSQQYLFEGGLLADYIFEKDRLFASVNLDGDEMALYDAIYNHIKPRMPSPELVIYLCGTVDLLVERIERRKRGFEKEISRSYLEALNDAYENFFRNYRDSHLLIVDAAKIDYIRSDEDYRELLNKINSIKEGAKEQIRLDLKIGRTETEGALLK